MNHWDEFSAFYDWELSIINPEQNQDIAFWREIIKQSPVLELACGSGRLTIPLAKAGLQITALDFSEKMLTLLQANCENCNVQDKIEPLQADMRDFQLKKQYHFALLGYFALQQLTNVSDQIRCLQTIHKHLEPNGFLGLDIYPCVCEGADISEKEMLYSAEYPFDNSQVTMFSSYTIDRLNLIKTWQDEYVKIRGNEEKRFQNQISLMECSPNYMKLLLEKCGFEVMEMYGSFAKDKVTEASQNILYVCRKFVQ